MEAPCQLALQIYVLSRGQIPGKFQDKLMQFQNISFDKLCFYFLIYLHRHQVYFYGIVCLLISETIQIVSILSSFATVVFNMADINRVGEELKSIPKVFAKMCALLTFAVSVCYRVMTLVIIIWLLSRWNIEQEDNFQLDSQQRTIKRAGFIFLAHQIILFVGIAFVHLYTLHKNKREEQKRNLFDMYFMFCGWYYTTVICGPILFLPNSKTFNRFRVYQKYFRMDAIVNLVIRNTILLALAVSYDYGYLNINEDLCSLKLINSYFSQICYYFLVPMGFFHYLMIEMIIRLNTFLQKLEILTILVHA